MFMGYSLPVSAAGLGQSPSIPPAVDFLEATNIYDWSRFGEHTGLMTAEPGPV
jgi:hypothetical protein